MKLSKILVPTDFSTCADNALRTAIHLCRRTDASILVYHAVEAAVYNEAAEAFYDVETETATTDAGFKALLKRIPELMELDYECTSSMGSVPDEVASLVKGVNADLVVMGTMGATGINEVLLGSNTYRVVRSLDVPVLVIPHNATINEVNNIVLAGDYKPIDADVLKPVKAMADLNGADIHIVHIAENTTLDDNETSEARKLNRYLKNYRHHYHLIESDDFEEALSKYCEDNKADLIAMIPRKHKLFDRIFDGGETKNMVYHTSLPLLAIPENA